MLFGLVMKGRPGTLNERSVRRMQWQPPEGGERRGRVLVPDGRPERRGDRGGGGSSNSGGDKARIDLRKGRRP